MTECDHVFCRMWHSGFDPRGLRPAGPNRLVADALWWCPRCEGIDTRIPDEPEPPADNAIGLVRAASWWVRLTERGGIEVEVSGVLSREEAGKLSRALGCADEVAEIVLMRLAGKSPTWMLEPREDNQLVISRWRGLDWKVGMTLLPITPRKATRCSSCPSPISAGDRAWRGAPAPAGLSTAEGASDCRFCMACVNAMSPTPIGKTRGQGAVLRLVAGGGG